ncbi:ABC transporter permease [Pseudooceanicola sp. HF7]|uniref:ABC transporter permease n=1 Tax=Pseudooceanicola sp. HF7 TaxID=2721560 RepID=UPI001430F699|nr:ABC transporter permease [Pseudooceanicola sp. HF7]NIZ09546.1 ABC transporter permease [Pseudooceanicola sp. HF7]
MPVQDLRAIAGKAGLAVLLLLAVVVLNFLLLHMAPGSPIEAMLGQMGGGSPEVIAELRADYGLDQPLPAQLGHYIVRLLQGDLGQSLLYHAPVSELILEHLGATMLLMLVALGLASVAGTLLGASAARRPDGLIGQALGVLSLAGFAAPVFWTGLMLMLLFAAILPIFPVSGMRDPRVTEGFWPVALDVAWHLVLPAVTLASVQLAAYARLARASMLQAVNADYIRTARAKGLSERRVIYSHALRNALLPVVTMLGVHAGQLLAGSVLVETVFAWPGLGRLGYDAILHRDYPLVLGLLLASAILVALANLASDIACRALDPRLRAGRSAP